MELNRRSFLKTGATMSGALAAGTAAATGVLSEGRAFADDAASDKAAEDASIPSGYVCTYDWLGTAPEIDDSQISETVQTDVLVIGGGNTGIQAQLAAAEGGVKVDVIERVAEADRKVDAEDVGHVNSQWLIDQGFGPYDEDEILRELELRSCGRTNPDLFRRFVANSGEMFDHMVSLVTWPNDKIKVTREVDAPYSPLDPSQCIVQQTGQALDGLKNYPVCRGGYKSYASSAQFMGTIIHDDEEAGAMAGVSRLDEFQQFAILRGQELGATWHFSESGVKLLTNEAGDVTGAITQKDDGSYVKYETSLGVILSTGDFGGNPDMVWNLCTEEVEWIKRAGGTKETTFCVGGSGDGQKMGCWVGGAIETSPRYRPTNPIADCPWGMSPILYLNEDGNRFMNEANIQGQYGFIRMQPAGKICYITDANWRDSVKLAGNEHFTPNFGRIEYWEELQSDMEDVPVDDPEGGVCRNMHIAERDPTTVYAASTIEGLLEMIGYEGESLERALAAIERYNDLCDAGKDTDYGKDAECMLPVREAPFYAAITQNNRGASPFIGSVEGGLVVDSYARVMSLADNKPIKGLYAAGCTSSAHQSLGANQAFCGTLLGTCMTFGRIAGKHITGQEDTIK